MFKLRASSASEWRFLVALGVAAAIGGAASLGACGGDQAAPVEPTSSLPLTTPSGAPAAIEPTPADTASTEPAASGAPDAGAPKATSTGSGRPPVLKTSDTSITDTFGAAPAKLELGRDKGVATLKIPDGALDKGYNITFEVDNKGKSNGAALGKVYHVKTQVAGGSEFTKIDSSGAPFEFSAPAAGRKDANLAIGATVTDDKGKEKLTWTVIAAKQVDSGVATFELPSIGGDVVLHLTTRAPSAK